MKARELFFQFINLVFSIALIGLAIAFLIYPGLFEGFTDLLKSLFPIAIIVVIYLIKSYFSREEREKRKYEGNDFYFLKISLRDKFLFELMVFFLPTVVLLIPILLYGKIDFIDLLQASIVFAGMLVWQKYLFNRED